MGTYLSGAFLVPALGRPFPCPQTMGEATQVLLHWGPSLAFATWIPLGVGIMIRSLCRLVVWYCGGLVGK